MDCYYLEITNIPKDKIHAGLRSFGGFIEPETYTCFLSINGRLSNSQSNRANLDSLDLAERFLRYWQPRLDKRGWGDFQCNIQKETADKWRAKQIPISSKDTINFLNEHAGNVIKQSASTKGNLIIVVTGIKTKSFLFNEGYWARHKKLGWVIASSKANAQRYKSEKYCLNIIKQHLSRPKDDLIARVHELSPKESCLIKEQKEEHWGFVFCRN